MAAGILNPKDDARATTSRPSESNPGAGSRKWFSDDLRTRPRAQDLNRIMAQIRGVIDFYSIPDVEGDDTLLRQAIQAAATSLSANLQAFSALSGSANKAPYFTAAGQMALMTVTSTARQLLDDTSFEQMRQTLGIDVALSDNVVAFGNLDSANDFLPYFNGVGSMATTRLTAAARSVLEGETALQMQTNLGMIPGFHIQVQSQALQDIADANPSGLSSFLIDFMDSGTASSARSTLGLGSIATHAANNVAITGGSIIGITDLAIADGGTGASTASGARSNLGLAVGSDVQAFDANLANLSDAPFTVNTLAFLAGKTSLANTPDGVDGIALHSGGILTVERSAGVGGHFNRRTSDGDTVRFYREANQVGSISVTTTATAYNTTSDGRLKDNVAPLSNAGDIIDALAPVAFDWKSTGKRSHGFIAQALHSVVPDAVTAGRGDPGDQDFEPWGVDFSKLVPYLVADAQQTHRRLEALERALNI